MRWVKQGVIIEPRGQAEWVCTHAALPVVLSVGDRDRIYFSSRDSRNRSHIGYVTLTLGDPARSQTFSATPVLSPGSPGAFDDAGVTSSCLVENAGRLYLFYTGWSLGVSVPFYLNAGLAVSDDGGQSFNRVSPAPLLDRSAVDPYLTASPWVLIEQGVWKMWYVSGSEWQTRPEGMRHRYHVKYAESRDGLAWDREGAVCIDYRSNDEYAFGRPCVVHDGSTYRMWYSSRGAAYRLGYAESADGIAWVRYDDRELPESSAAGFDSEMMTYPVVTARAGRRMMLYNGNGYGRTGIGLATESA